MLKYQTSLNNAPPPATALANSAQRAFQQSPYAGQNHQDVFRGLGQQQAVDLSNYARRQEDEYAARQQDAERGLALAGLNMMGQGQQNQMNLGTQRMRLLLNSLL